MYKCGYDYMKPKYGEKLKMFGGYRYWYLRRYCGKG